MKDNEKELLPLVDESGAVVGSASRGECHGGAKLLHPVVHLHVFDRSGRLYLQRRPQWKDIQPGRWDTAVGGHVDYGESVADALLREAREELGLTDFKYEHMISYVFESERERELINAYRATIDFEPAPSAETAGGRFWSFEEIHDTLGKGVFTPNFEKEFLRLFDGGE